MKKFFISIIFLTVLSSLFAMPGFESYIPDTSGEYVYYRDYSFARESYIGLLYYNESTYQIRYYAPKNPSQNLPEKSIAIAVTVDPKSSYWNMTGEKILTTISNDSHDLDILNYLHDILYDFSAKRNKIDNLSLDNPKFNKSSNFKDRGLKYTCDYPQFGGTVSIIYDPLVPLFNLKSIYGADGKVLFDCITTGCLIDSADKSFDNFKGITIKVENGKQVKKAKAKTFKTNDNQTITADENWTNPMENGIILDDQAFIAMTTIPTSSDSNLNNEAFKYYLIRHILENSAAYTVFDDIELLYDSKSNQYKVTTKSVVKDSSNTMLQLSIITEKNGKVYYLTFTSKYGFYTKNLNYFNKIIKSYSIK